MSLEHRLKIFYADVDSKKRFITKKITYTAYYKRLYLTRRVAEFFIGTLLIFQGQQFILQSHFLSPIWLAAGVGLAAVFLRGNFLLLSIFVGTALAYLNTPYPYYIVFIQSLFFMLYIYLSRLFSLRLIGAIAPIADYKIFLKFIILVGLVTAVHISLLPGLPNEKDKLLAWLGELTGIVTVTPLCLIFDPFVPARYFNKKSSLWMIISLIIILSHGLFLLYPTGIYCIILSLFFLVIMALYGKIFGQVPTCITLLGMSIFYISNTPQATSTPLQMVILHFILLITGILSICVARPE